ncbi:hypothetical protein Tco_0969685 [Tanacetum coccineum]
MDILLEHEELGISEQFPVVFSAQILRIGNDIAITGPSSDFLEEYGTAKNSISSLLKLVHLVPADMQYVPVQVAAPQEGHHVLIASIGSSPSEKLKTKLESWLGKTLVVAAGFRLLESLFRCGNDEVVANKRCGERWIELHLWG